MTTNSDNEADAILISTTTLENLVSVIRSTLSQIRLRCRSNNQTLRDFRTRVIHDSTIRLLSFVIPIIIICSIKISPVGVIFLGIVLGISATSIAASIFHDAVHHNLPVSNASNVLLGRITGGILGFSYSWWRIKHLEHHRLVGESSDPDIQFGSLFRLSPLLRHHPLHRIQIAVLPLLIPFATISMLRPSDISRTIRRANPQSDIQKVTLFFKLVAEKYAIFILIWAALSVFIPAKMLILLFVCFEISAGIMVSLVTQLQHNTAITIDGYTEQLTPILRQFYRSSDVRSITRIWTWISGSTNYHVLHHLSPDISYLDLPLQTQYFRNTLNEQGFEVPTLSGPFMGIKSFLRAIRIFSRPSTDFSNVRTHT